MAALDQPHLGRFAGQAEHREDPDEHPGGKGPRETCPSASLSRTLSSLPGRRSPGARAWAGRAKDSGRGLIQGLHP
ncbi:hypothetical protein GCM10010214_19780 [Streptomyces abikoensis]|nr:hypothetical protein GCM10010214_19780 [Streptomyces abikoensis]